jgi:hypothetical protein
MEVPIIGLAGLIGYGMFGIVRLTIEILLVLPLVLGAVVGFRQNEYAADRFVVESGYGEGLHSYLMRRLDDPQEVSGNWILKWIRKLIWPDVGKRLFAIEKIM